MSAQQELTKTNSEGWATGRHLDLPLTQVSEVLWINLMAGRFLEFFRLESSDWEVSGDLRYSDLIARRFLEIFRLDSSEVF